LGRFGSPNFLTPTRKASIVSEPTPLSDLTVYEMPIDALVGYAGNPRVGNVAAIAESLRINGQYRPIVVRKETREVLAGNHTLKAATSLGWKTVKATIVENISDEAAARIVLADNRLNDVASYDNKALAEMLQQLETLSGTGYDKAYLDYLLDGLKDEPQQLTDPDDVPEVPELPQTISKPGDVWQLADHRLVCGDSLAPETYAALTQGRQMDCVITDPPYNVAVAQFSSVEEAKRLKKRTDGLTIKNDSMGAVEFERFIASAFERMYETAKPGAPIYVFHSETVGAAFRNTYEAAGWMLKEVLIWVKSSLVLSRQDYHWQHEPILYGWKPGAAHYWEGGRTQTTVIDEQPDFSEMKKEDLLKFLTDLYATTTAIREPKPSRNAEHPTMKPVALIARLMNNSSPYQGAVLDPFAGSGSTLIAAHALGRTAYLIELDPRYADVICRRFQEHTGIVPVLEATAQPHDFVKAKKVA
jgi:DNA modification methylase